MAGFEDFADAGGPFRANPAVRDFKASETQRYTEGRRLDAQDDLAGGSGVMRVADIVSVSTRDSGGKVSFADFTTPDYGARVDGTPKGLGFFGELKRPDGKVSTELSAGFNFDGKEREVPLLVPTLTQAEITHLLAGKEPTKLIEGKAIEHAQQRIAAGKSPFAQPGEQRSLGAPSFTDFSLPSAAPAERILPAGTTSTFRRIVSTLNPLNDPASVAAIGDMIVSLPGQLVGVGADMGARLTALGHGETRRLGAQAGAEGREIASGIMNPFEKLMKATGFGKDYDESNVTQAVQKLGSWLDKGAEWIEKRTDGALLKEDVDSIVNAVMAAGGVGGLRAGIRGARGRPEAPAREGVYDRPPRLQLPGPESGTTLEGEFSRVPEPQRNAALASAGEWARQNALPASVAASLAAWTALGDRPEEGLIGLGLLGAMKGKGGMWHPKAAETIAKPLKLAFERDYHGGDLEASHPLNVKLTWAERSAATYLNRHMGTESDPLRDIEIPFGEGTKKWGEVTDGLVTSRPAAWPDPGIFPGSKGEGDALWRVGPMVNEGPFSTAMDAPARALRSYLSHVGDFLRENVPADKLPQYDLVRAVKETAKRDAEMARAMEREAAESSKDLPVYKDYGDGTRWVELKLADKLTLQQARFIRPATEAELDFRADSHSPTLREQGHTLVAIDTEGKPISNNYTKAYAGGTTPENTHLAGQLAREGNQMGHCVGGYCEGVASGESRIFSLRDAKGKSHVTVEVAPPGPHGYPVQQFLKDHPEVNERIRSQLITKEMYESDLNPEWVDLLRAAARTPEYAAWLKEKPSSILQIKGKQNRAPAVPYLPYVQDFVKGGRWGEVGDLEGTGLRRAGKYYLSLADFQEAAFEHGKAGPNKVTWPQSLQRHLDAGIPEQTARENWLHGAEDGNTVLVEPPEDYIPKSQRGSADPALLARLAAAGAGAALGAYFDDRPARGAAIGAILGLALASLRPTRGGALRGLDEALGVVSTRLSNIDPAITRRARDFELSVSTKTDKAYAAVMPFIKALEGLPAAQFKALDMAYMKNDGAAIRQTINGKPKMEEAYRAVRSTLGKFESDLKSLHRFKEGLTEYLPLVVKDLDGLMKALGEEHKAGLEKALAVAEAEMVRTRKRGMTEVEQSVAVNAYLKGRPPTSSLPGYARHRGVEMMEELRPFYASVRESLLRYVAAATQDVETARFFGKDLKTNSQGGKKFTDVDDSVGEVVSRAMREGKMTPDQALVVAGILRARFGPGEQAPIRAIQELRNFTNLTLLGQFHAAGTQLGDSVMTVYHHGLNPYAHFLRPMLEAIGMKLTGQGVSPKEFGLVNHIAEEFNNSTITGKGLALALKINAFTAIDRFAKGLSLTAAFQKDKILARSEGGRRELERRWQKYYGDDFPQLVTDLQNRQRTPLVDSLLWAELSDTQPVAKTELPQAFLEHPNGRLFYQMKTYMLKQADVLRREAYNEIKSGSPKRIGRGLAALFGFAAFLSLSNVPGDLVKDWLSGKAIDLTKIDWIENLLQNFGLNRYAQDQARKGKPVEVARDIILPPYKHLQDIARMDAKSVKYIPPAGRVYYDRMLGGAERKAKFERDRDRKEQEKNLSPEEKRLNATIRRIEGM